MSKQNGGFHAGLVVVILGLSVALRIILVSLGGQKFFPDEIRYETSRVAADFLWRGDIAGALKALNSADHLLFKAIGVLPALLQIKYGPNPTIPAMFFSLFSVASLWLAWGIMLRTGANRRAALLAISLFALCSTQLYYSRHLVPYDTAMAFGLLAVFLGLRKPLRTIDSILCGISSASCFLTYNGYWLLGSFAMLVHVFQQPRPIMATVKRGLWSALGFFVPIALIISISTAAGGDLLGSFIKFSGTVKQGVFSEGWELPISYFWHSEHLLILLWAGALLFGVWDAVFGSREPAVRFALGGIIFVYGSLVTFSVYLEKFMVYGRLAKQMVPFWSILAALFLDRIWTSHPRRCRLVIGILLMVICQVTYNFSQFYTQTFPSDFLNLASTTSKEGFPYRAIRWSDAAVTTETEKYRVLYSHYIYPAPRPDTESGEVILQRRHPQQFMPYLYEGFTPDERSKFQSTDIQMRVVRRKIQ